MARITATALGAIVVMSLAGCATNFSAPGVRAEIARQTGAEPKEAFEVYAGPVTMAVLRGLLRDPAPASSKASPSATRVTSFEIAVYELARRPGAPPVDFTRMPVRGWEPSLRFRSDTGSGMVLVRTSGGAVGDLVVLSSDDDGAIYGRIRGTLPTELPVALGRIVKEGGTAEVRREIEALSKE